MRVISEEQNYNNKNFASNNFNVFIPTNSLFVLVKALPVGENKDT
jgi:hypothetical protein